MTGKTRFSSRAAAKRALKYTKRISASLRIYKCPFCGDHHLTKDR